jgi:two-component system, NtrC family, response regulator GlrR
MPERAGVAPGDLASRSFGIASPDRENELGAACAALGLVGGSPAFTRALRLARAFAACDAPVLLRGRTGNGKELFARALHYLSRRRGRPFIPVNCGAIPDSLLETELFGHARGAFTDAKRERPGLVALAAGGTFFMDEVDSLTPKAQVALLRFLQDGEYRPVGALRAQKADLRILAATNTDLKVAVAEGRFRQDLLFRLDVLDLYLPSLAERRDDIPLLARHFLARFAALYGGSAPCLTAEGEDWLLGQAWHGNVRELENRMHRAFVLAERGEVGCAELTGAPAGEAGAGAVDLYGEPTLAAGAKEGLKAACARERWAFEDRYLRELMAVTHGNVSDAARRACTERRAMGRLLKRHGIDRANYQG